MGFWSQWPYPSIRLQGTTLELSDCFATSCRGPECLGISIFPEQPQPMTDCCGRMRAQLTCPQILCSISVSKEPDLYYWVTEWGSYEILCKFKSLLENFAITKMSTTFLLVLSQTLMDLLFTTWIYGKINYPGHFRKDSASKVISQTITINHWKKEMTASVPINHAELHFFEWMLWFEQHHSFENNRTITKIK